MNLILTEFDKDTTAIIEPHMTIGENVKDFPEIGVSCFSAKLINRFVELYKGEQIASLGSSNGEVPIYKIIYGDKPIALFMSRIGAAACVVGFEEIIAMGLKRLILFGSCGVLNHEIVDGHVIIPTSAIRDEGTSYHYGVASDEINADEESINSLITTFERLEAPYVKGKTWTTDAPYRETTYKTADRRNRGCISVEMECSAMIAVAKFRDIKLAQFFYAADNLDSKKWEPRGLGHTELVKREKYMLLALECASNF